MISHVTPPRVQYILQYIDINGVIQTEDITSDFSDWSSFESDIVRDNLTGAYVQIQNGGISFTGNSKTLLQSIYETTGVSSVANLIVNLRNDTFPNLWTYIQKIVLNLNFTTYERTYTEITIEANQNGLMQLVKANGGQKFDIPIEILDPGYVDQELETLEYTLGALVSNPVIASFGGTVGSNQWGFFALPVQVASQIVSHVYSNYLEQFSNELCKLNASTWQEWDLSQWNNVTLNEAPFFILGTTAGAFNFTIKGILEIAFDHLVTNVTLALISSSRELIQPILLGDSVQSGFGYSINANLNSTIEILNATPNTSYYLQLSFNRILAATSEDIKLVSIQFASGSFIQVQTIQSTVTANNPEILNYDGLEVNETMTYFTGDVASGVNTDGTPKYPNLNLANPVPDVTNGGYTLAFLPAFAIETQSVNPVYNNFMTFFGQPLMVYDLGAAQHNWYEWNGSNWYQSPDLINPSVAGMKPLFKAQSAGNIKITINGTLTFNFGNPVNAGALYLIKSNYLSDPANPGSNYYTAPFSYYLTAFSQKICDIPANPTGNDFSVYLNSTNDFVIQENEWYYIACIFNYTNSNEALYYRTFQFTSNSYLQIEWAAKLTVPLKIPLVKEQNLLQALVNSMAETQGATYVVSYAYVDSGVNKVAIQNVTLGNVPAKDVTVIYPYYTYLTNSGIITPTITRPLYAVSPTDPNYVQFPTGSFSSIPIGLVIDSVTGAIDTNKSLPGSYLITYSFTNNKNYADFFTFNFTITNQGTSFSYPLHLDPSQVSASPTFVSGNITGGTFSAALLSPYQIQSIPCGLVIDPVTGIIDLVNSSEYQYIAKIDDHAEFSGTKSNVRIAAGESIRGFMSQFIHTSLNDFISYMRSVWGYEYEIKDNLIHFATRDTFFLDEPALTIPEITDYKISVNQPNIFSGVKIGIPLVQYLSINGTDEFRFLEQWSTNVKNIVNTLDLTSPYRTDAFGFQLLSEKQYLTNNSDDQSDSGIFVVHVNEISPKNFILDRTILIQGVQSPLTMFNVIFSPRQCLARNASLLGVSGNTLKFTSTLGYAGVVINGIPETSDIEVSNALFTTEVLEMSVGEIVDLPALQNGYVTCSYRGETFLGFIKKLTHFWGNDQKTTATLYLKPSVTSFVPTWINPVCELNQITFNALWSNPVCELNTFTALVYMGQSNPTITTSGTDALAVYTAGRGYYTDPAGAVVGKTLYNDANLTLPETGYANYYLALELNGTGSMFWVKLDTNGVIIATGTT